MLKYYLFSNIDLCSAVWFLHLISFHSFYFTTFLAFSTLVFEYIKLFSIPSVRHFSLLVSNENFLIDGSLFAWPITNRKWWFYYKNKCIILYFLEDTLFIFMLKLSLSFMNFSSWLELLLYPQLLKQGIYPFQLLYQY